MYGAGKNHNTYAYTRIHSHTFHSINMLATPCSYFMTQRFFLVSYLYSFSSFFFFFVFFCRLKAELSIPRVVIVGGREAAVVAEDLARAQVSVVVSPML